MQVELIIPEPHSQGQEDLINSNGMDVVFCGRRWGKTHTGVQRIERCALQDPGLYWWVGLGWKSASLKRAWRELKAFTTQSWSILGEKPERHIRESAKEIDLPGGSEIWMRTAERPDSLAGEGIKGCVLDEFTLMKENVWTEYVEATLLDYNGWALFIGVPKGNNWGAKLWKNCEHGPEAAKEWRGTRSGWRAWHYPTTANPLLSPEKFEDIRRNTPSTLFSQEYLAEIIEGAGLVFKNINACVGCRQLPTPIAGHIYAFGLDWGKKNDYTVVTVLDLTTKQVVNITRFNDLDYPTQLKRVMEVYQIFKPRCIVAEENAMGGPLCDQLLADGLPIKRFYTTNSSKREVIEALQVAFEQEKIRIPDNKILINELESYEMNLTATGTIRYSAPEGEHDDCVMSLAMAWNEARYDLGISF